MMAKDRKFLESNLRIRVDAALLAQRRNMEARSEAGIETTGQLIWTRAEVTELLDESRETWMMLLPLIEKSEKYDWKVMLPIIARQTPADQRMLIRIIERDPSLPNASAFARLAKLAVTNARTHERARRGETIIDLLKPKKGK
jgi:hypothetical protein